MINDGIVRRSKIGGWMTLAVLLCLGGLVPAGMAAADGWQEDEFLVLCYHDVPKAVDQDLYGVDRTTFIQTIEYLRTHGYHFISVDDVIAARAGGKALPEKPVLLTFDDAYQSFFEFVLPLLREYRYPCVLAVVTKWIDSPPDTVKQKLMNWEELKQAAESGLVEIAAHTHDLHHGVIYNPQGNEAPAVNNRIYDPAKNAYETEEEFRLRIAGDLAAAKKTLESRLGIKPRSLVWPYGEYNEIGLAEAEKLGFQITFSLEDRPASVKRIPVIDRVVLYKNPSLEELIKDFQRLFRRPAYQRIMQADLDLIYDPDPTRTEENLGRFLDRVVKMKVDTVYLQAFADPDGNGNVASVYFPNRVLPVRQDLFNRVCNQLEARQISVYAWMPMLAIMLPDRAETESLRVREFAPDGSRLSGSWYRRLSPFSPRTGELLVRLYEDLAADAQISGVIFQDDGYLAAGEDFHPDALPFYRKIAGDEKRPPDELTADEQREWTGVKTQKLIELTGQLQQAVRRYRPKARFVRTLYAPVLTDPGEAATEFAQDYRACLDAYDYVAVMAYPRMEEIKRPERWFSQLADAARSQPDGIGKTVFKVQTYDWKQDRWIETGTVNRWLRRLTAAGARHLAYYPDDYTIDQPRQDVIRKMMSTEDFPFRRK